MQQIAAVIINVIAFWVFYRIGLYRGMRINDMASVKAALSTFGHVLEALDSIKITEEQKKEMNKFLKVKLKEHERHTTN